MRKKEVLKNFKNKLSKGESVFGIGCASHSPILIEMAGYIGFDFVFIDTQHVPIESDLVLENLIRAAEVADIVPIVRVKENEEWFIRCAIESGAKGVVVPRISSKEEAQKAVNAAKFPPLGTRHGNLSVRAANWGCGIDWDSFVKLSNEEVMVIPLIENKEGIDNLVDILSVDGINAVSFGPTDYALSLGLNLHYAYGDPIIDEAFNKCLDLARDKNIPVLDSFKPFTVEQSKKLAKQGMTMQLVGGDSGLLKEGLFSIMENFVKEVKK